MTKKFISFFSIARVANYTTSSLQKENSHKNSTLSTQFRVKFYTAQILLALRYIHKKDIVYRDLKPQNILIDKEGYIKLTDFGLSKKLKKNDFNKFSLSGMPEYTPPEILNYQECSKAVDFWCLGSLMYEMLTGYVPFFSQNLNELYENIKEKKFVPDKEANLSPNCIDLLKKLFIKDPNTRFGMNVFNVFIQSENQIENHPWFSGINWDGVLTKKYRAPFIPILQSQDDTSYFCPEITETSVHSITRYDQTHSAERLSEGNQFEGFDFYGDSEEQKSQKDPGSPKKLVSQKKKNQLFD